MTAHRLLLFLLVCGGLTHAQTINRCVDAAGKVSYSSAPCPSDASTVKSLEAAPPPSSSPGTNAPVPEYKQKELELQQRRQGRLAREREEEAEVGRIKAHEERVRQQKEQDAVDANRRAYEAANQTRSQQLREMGIDGY